jgi:hypothetical protein
MPFTVNVGPYVGGELMARGLAQAGQNLGQGILAGYMGIQEAQKQEQADELILQHALQSGQIKPEQYAEFKDMSRTKKNGVVAGLARNFAQDVQQKQTESLVEQREASIAARQAQTELLPEQIKALVAQREASAEQAKSLAEQRTRGGAYANTPIWVTGPDGKPVQAGVYGPEGTPHFFPGTGGAAGVTKGGKPVISKELPGYNVLYQEGTGGFQVVPEIAPSDSVWQYDAQGNMFRVNRHGERIPATQNDIIASRLGKVLGDKPDLGGETGGGAAAPAAPAAPGIGNWINSIFQRGNVPTGMPTGIPSAPAPSGKVVPPAAAAPKLSAQDQQALEWAKTHLNDPRAAAILRKLGVTG